MIRLIDQLPMNNLRIFPKVAQVRSTLKLHVLSFVAGGFLRWAIFKFHSNPGSVGILVGPLSNGFALFFF
jgi:hypothetical protein